MKLRKLVGWPVPTSPIYRVAVRRRKPHGMFDILDMQVSGRRWSWWCSCDADPHHTQTQTMALHMGLSHLADIHDERPLRHR